jgi:Fur family peroxide stress response transcriptional regulator
MNNIDLVVERFRDSGLKITPQRLAIFNLLKDNREHPSVENIYQEVLKTHPSISFTTVYKTLQTLRDMGEIVEITIDPERVHYDPDMTSHAHTFCTSCREIEDLMADDGLAPIPQMDLADTGFTVNQVQVHLVGVCEGCATN